jgi:hypothetical protein
MAKETGPTGTSGKNIQKALSSKTEGNSGQTGQGVDGVWINDHGEVCVGNKCFTLAINTTANEVTVRVDRNECGADMQPIVDSIFEVIGKGGRTLYESTSVVKKS